MNSTYRPRDCVPSGQQPLVSVIIPAYNAEAFIGDAAQSMAAQTFTDWELIVIDDGSEDPEALEAALAPYQHRLHLIRQANAGVSAARNAGIQAARGRYLAFLDSDDGWEPEFLATQVEMLEADPSLTLVYCDATLRGDPGIEGRRAMEFSPSTGAADLLGLVSMRCTVLTSCTVVNREAVLTAGLFDTGLVVSEDFDLWLRLLLRGGRFTYHSQPLGWRRVREGSLSRDTVRMLRAGIAILESHLGELSRFPEAQTAAAKTIRKLRGNEALVLGKQALLEGNHPVARLELAKAREILGGTKLATASWLARRVPRFMTATYRLIDRYRSE
ncbi:MAG: glycosyltransferase family 2 protein [Gemmatimonadales bacterium]